MNGEDLKERVYELFENEWFEGTCLEFKSAKGGLPKEMWPTYSAFANTLGGIILLGVDDDGEICGVANPVKYKEDIFNQLNNPQKCSLNLCDETMVQELQLEGKNVLAMYVPQALPEQRPVYIRDREDNSYLRSASADVRCKREDLIRMRRNRDIAECPTYSQDDVIIPHTTLKDLDAETFKKFRNHTRYTQMGGILQGLDDVTFLKKVGAYRRDRETNQEGLTLAGLLMLGSSDALAELRPHFQLDFFEYEESEDPNARWCDRITNDGSWPGNLYEFFFRVLPRLVDKLKRPFKLDENLIRQDDSPAHIAVREAFANALIHADYHELFGVRVEKRPTGLVFMNPGSLLVPRTLLFSEHAHISICRNKSLQRMFQALGVVDHAGSGIDKIVRGWLDSCISVPTINELQQPDRVVWNLNFVGILSKENLSLVAQCIGKSRFDSLDLYDKLILVCIAASELTRHADMAPLLPLHPFELSQRLARLVAQHILSKSGRARATKYALVHNTKDEEIDEIAQSAKIEYPELVKAIRESNWTSKRDMKEAILLLCSDNWCTVAELSKMLQRERRTILRYCDQYVRENILELRYSETLRHPQQAYRVLK